MDTSGRFPTSLNPILLAASTTFAVGLVTSPSSPFPAGATSGDPEPAGDDLASELALVVAG